LAFASKPILDGLAITIRISIALPHPRLLKMVVWRTAGSRCCCILYMCRIHCLCGTMIRGWVALVGWICLRGDCFSRGALVHGRPRVYRAVERSIRNTRLSLRASGGWGTATAHKSCIVQGIPPTACDEKSSISRGNKSVYIMTKNVSMVHCIPFYNPVKENFPHE